MATEPKSELLRGTLDMLILKIVALGPNHGYAIAQRLRQISKEFFTVHQGSLYPAFIVLRIAAGFPRNGVTPIQGAKRSFTI
jgi:hypothetical protein